MCVVCGCINRVPTQPGKPCKMRVYLKKKPSIFVIFNKKILENGIKPGKRGKVSTSIKGTVQHHLNF